jgi:hypothetical protein
MGVATVKLLLSQYTTQKNNTSLSTHELQEIASAYIISSAEKSNT